MKTAFAELEFCNTLCVYVISKLNSNFRAQNTLVQKEEELAHVKLLYCAAVKEKQVRYGKTG